MSTKEQQRTRRQPTDQPPHTASSKEEAAKIERIAGHTAGLVEDLKSWFELRIEYAVLDFKEEIKSAGQQLAYHASFLAVLAIAGLFGATALAFGIGAWLGHPAWGFLVVAALLVVMALTVRWVGKRAKRMQGKVPSYSYRVNDKKPALAQKGSKESTARKLKPKGSKQLATPEFKGNNHGKDQ